MNKTTVNSYSKKKLVLSSLFFIILLGCTFYILLKNENLFNLLNTIKEMNPFFISLGLLAVFIYICSEAINLLIILASLNTKIGFIQALKYAFIGFYFCAITPSSSGGQPMQVYYMKKDGIKITKSSLAMVTNLVIYKIVLLLLCAFILIFNYFNVMQHINKIWILFIIGITVHILTVVILLMSIFYKDKVTKLFFSITNLLYKLNFIKDKKKWQLKIKTQVNEFAINAKYIFKKPKLLIQVAAVTFIQVVSLYSVPYFVYKAFSLNSYSIFSIISLQAILRTSISTIPLPGAVGIAEGSFLLLYKAFFPEQQLTSAMLVSRGISFYSFLIISCFVTLITHVCISRKQLKRSKAINLKPVQKKTNRDAS
ncbi:flippase-like domain-containing protein [Clostridium sp. 'deep sea']|uniref:lysylphosphatidylglycerol synthase transmembrane domain-containing protein n=1 Tax=Clostridium sp. 'deep sea' TaxID=2779445 RepID=UPI00189680A0|nr:lysylphosphatidylglycerol synthase transmembrane domain-containing protein [Clostridium sp. 'deep sea']QOR36101.1 flippase-like domain-containing protein [Clostridium sp. 'deep sea']